MSKEVMIVKGAPTAIGPYNQAVQANGFYFFSGQIPLDPATGNLVEGDIKAQTRQVLTNIQNLLLSVSKTFSDVVKSTVFLTDLANFAGMNEIYQQFFTQDFPARSTIQVAGLPKGAAVEIEVIVAN